MAKINVESSFIFSTWNIDGLDDKNIKERTMAVINDIQYKRFDVVFLQEVVSETYQLIEMHLTEDYNLTENKS